MVDVSFTLHAQKEAMDVSIFGDKGGATIEPKLEIVTEKHDTMLNLTPQIDALTFDFVTGFQNEVNHFVECVQGNETTISPVEDGLEIMKILSAVYHSSETGTEVTF